MNAETSSYFIRPDGDPAATTATLLTPLEHAIETVLKSFPKDDDDDGEHNNNIVEYWSRDEYMNLDAHEDIDEELLEPEQDDEATPRRTMSTTSKLRYAKWAHVLYLQVHLPAAPTCVLHPSHPQVKERLDLLTVPAVQGRLLRFPGNLMHGVPKPPHRWLMSLQEESELRSTEIEEAVAAAEEMYEEEEDYDDDLEEGGEDDVVVERAVILFNTWAGPSPPNRVKRDPLTASADLLNEAWSSEHYGGFDLQTLLTCHPKSQWVQAPIQLTPTAARAPNDHDAETTENSNVDNNGVYIHLMGDEDRRRYADTMFRAKCNERRYNIREALQEPRQPFRFHLNRPKDS